MTEAASGAATPLWQVGDEVILNGWGVGETHSGDLAQMARVKGDWLMARFADVLWSM